MATRFRQVRALTEMMKSPEILGVLEGIGEKVLALASNDPNQAYVDTLEMNVFESRSRLTVQVGAAPGLGMAVEAKRGTLARALGGVST